MPAIHIEHRDRNIMTTQDIVRYRLYNQQITHQKFATVGELVSYMGAMQGQDYAAALWAIGLRLKNNPTLAHIEQAIVKKEIVRSWPMRGTLHFVSPDDLRWMQALTTPKLLSGIARRWQNLGLDEKTTEKSKEAFAKALKGGNILTRQEMMEVLDRAGISPEGQRGYHLLWHASQTGLLCFGPAKGKGQTFVLLDEWIPNYRKLTREASLAEFAKKYFTSHGPASMQDFMWWTGLPARDLTIGIELVKADLHRTMINNKSYWMGKNIPDIASVSESAYLLAPFDEYLLGYRDRSTVLDLAHAQKIVPGLNGMFKPIIVVDGQVVGIWQRIIKKDSVNIALHPFNSLTNKQYKAISAAATRYGEFLGMPINILDQSA